MSPHPSGAPGSVWDLPWMVWTMCAAFVDRYVEQMREANHVND